jgi:IMP dehydrogenase
MKKRIKPVVALSFDDILIEPSFSKILPVDVDIRARLTRAITLSIPIASAAMDRVTEASLAIAMAQRGGIGILHKNMKPEDQAKQVASVKHYTSHIIYDPITVRKGWRIGEVKRLRRKYGNRFSSFPVINGDGKLIGLLTGNDYRLSRSDSEKVSDRMTKEVVKVLDGVTVEKARRIMEKRKIGKLVVVDSEGRLKGLITMGDIDKAEEFPDACRDNKGHLRVGAAVGSGGDYLGIVGELIRYGVDVVAVESAHADSKGVLAAIRAIKRKYPECQLIGGNVATVEGAIHLIKAGVDAVKVGIGAGSICTTRIIAGIGVPQFSAILEVAKVCHAAGVPLIGDGGIKSSGDIVKALAAGASCVMIGNLLAGTDEAPGEIILRRGRSYKSYRGMGSIGALAEGDGSRYLQKSVAEGVEGIVPSRGSVADVLHELVGGVRSGMGYAGCGQIKDLWRTKIIRITAAGLRESHVHDVEMTEEAPNYSPST